MTFNWQELAQSLGGQAVFLAVLAYLFKTLISSRLERETETFKAKLQSDATFQIEALKIKLQAETNTEIEKLKGGLQIAALEHQIRFSKLHEQRLPLISQLAKDIQEVPAVVADFVIRNIRAKESLGEALTRAALLAQLIQTNRFLLPSALATLLDEFSLKLTRVVTFVGVYWTREEAHGPYVRPEHREQQNQVLQESMIVIENEIPALRKQIEAELAS